jgi:colanic acid/amylovoran biosynthesis glycosyltransferase
VTLATGRKPTQEWLLQPNMRWLFTPAWDRPVMEKAFHLAAQAGGAMLRGGKDLRTFSYQVRRVKSRRGRLAFWQRLLPFAGRRWDVIYFPWNSAAIEYLPLMDLGMPAVVSCRGSQINIAPHNPERRVFRQGLQETFARVSGVHCVSKAILQEAIQYGLDPTKARIIHPAVDPDFFSPQMSDRRDASIFRIITTGSLTWVKGHECACAVVRLLKERGVPVHFEIVGDGPERQRLLYTIHDLELQEDVFLAGQLPPEAVRQRLQNADAFVLSSLSEGISNAALEAMACGLPVATTDAGGMGEAVTDGVEGLVTPVRDSAALAAALERLWREPELRARMGAAARQRVVRDFSLPDQVAQFVELLSAL